MDPLYIFAITPAAGGTASIRAASNIVDAKRVVDDLPKFLTPGYDWSVAKVFPSSGHTVPLTKAQIFGLFEEMTELDHLLYDLED